MAATILGALIGASAAIALVAQLGVTSRRTRVSARRRGRGHALGSNPGGHHLRGRVPCLRLPVRPAALHLHHQQPRRVAQPAAAPGRGPGHRPARGHPGRTRTGVGPAGPRGSGSLRHQPCPGRDANRRGGGADRARASGAAAAMDRIWFGLGATPAEETTIADTAPGQPLPVPAWQVVLQRSPGDEPARWVRMHVATALARRKADRATVHRVRVEASGEALGSVWALRAREEREPDRAETRILSAAADQLGQAIVRDRVALERTNAEIARRSEALKTALLDSVSHDLRTPLATIRAAAGSMLDESVTWTEEDHREAFQAIDSEAERMGRLVRNLLDLSRIEGGALKPELEPCDLDDLVSRGRQTSAAGDDQADRRRDAGRLALARSGRPAVPGPGAGQPARERGSLRRRHDPSARPRAARRAGRSQRRGRRARRA